MPVEMHLSPDESPRFVSAVLTLNAAVLRRPYPSDTPVSRATDTEGIMPAVFTRQTPDFRPDIPVESAAEGVRMSEPPVPPEMAAALVAKIYESPGLTDMPDVDLFPLHREQTLAKARQGGSFDEFNRFAKRLPHEDPEVLEALIEGAITIARCGALNQFSSLFNIARDFAGHNLEGAERLRQAIADQYKEKGIPYEPPPVVPETNRESALLPAPDAAMSDFNFFTTLNNFLRAGHEPNPEITTEAVTRMAKTAEHEGARNPSDFLHTRTFAEYISGKDPEAARGLMEKMFRYLRDKVTDEGTFSFTEECLLGFAPIMKDPAVMDDMNLRFGVSTAPARRVFAYHSLRVMSHDADTGELESLLQKLNYMAVPQDIIDIMSFSNMECADMPPVLRRKLTEIFTKGSFRIDNNTLRVLTGLMGRESLAALDARIPRSLEYGPQENTLICYELQNILKGDFEAVSKKLADYRKLREESSVMNGKTGMYYRLTPEEEADWWIKNQKPVTALMEKRPDILELIISKNDGHPYGYAKLAGDAKLAAKFLKSDDHKPLLDYFKKVNIVPDGEIVDYILSNFTDQELRTVDLSAEPAGEKAIQIRKLREMAERHELGLKMDKRQLTVEEFSRLLDFDFKEIILRHPPVAGKDANPTTYMEKVNNRRLGAGLCIDLATDYLNRNPGISRWQLNSIIDRFAGKYGLNNVDLAIGRFAIEVLINNRLVAADLIEKNPDLYSLVEQRLARDDGELDRDSPIEVEPGLMGLRIVAKRNNFLKIYGDNTKSSAFAQVDSSMDSMMLHTVYRRDGPADPANLDEPHENSHAIYPQLGPVRPEVKNGVGIPSDELNMELSALTSRLEEKMGGLVIREMSNEIIAKLKSRDVDSFFRGMFARDGAYDYTKDLRSRFFDNSTYQEAVRLFEERCYVAVDEAERAVGKLLLDGYNNDEVVGLLMPVLLTDWPRYVRQFLSTHGKAKETAYGF